MEGLNVPGAQLVHWEMKSGLCDRSSRALLSAVTTPPPSRWWHAFTNVIFL